MGRLALIVFMIAAAVVGVRSLTGNSDAGSVDGASVDGDLITLISKGEAVEISDHVPAEGMVLVEFTADW